MMHNAIAILAVGLMLACVASITFMIRHHRMEQAGSGQDGSQGDQRPAGDTPRA